MNKTKKAVYAIAKTLGKNGHDIRKAIYHWLREKEYSMCPWWYIDLTYRVTKKCQLCVAMFKTDRFYTGCPCGRHSYEYVIKVAKEFLAS